MSTDEVRSFAYRGHTATIGRKPEPMGTSFMQGRLEVRYCNGTIWIPFTGARRVVESAAAGTAVTVNVPAVIVNFT